MGDSGGDNNLTSILDIDLEDEKLCANLDGKIDSPRTMEAMAILGLEPKELESIKMEDVRNYYITRDRNPNINHDLCDLRYNTLN